MPGWTGLQMLAGMTNVPGHPSVVLMTAFGSADFHSQAQALGAAAILDKPFDVDLLRAMVDTILAPRLYEPHGTAGSPP